MLDAPHSLREFLSDQAVHDYGRQGKGPDSKITTTAWFVGSAELSRTVATLYRPNSGDGDPRIWFKSLPNYAKAGNVLSVLVVRGDLVVVNASDQSLMATADEIGTPLHNILHSAQGVSGTTGVVVNPFLERLLTLQQDGTGAISAPSSWSELPVLEISETVTYRSVDRMLSHLAADPSVPAWHFFVGSPGNGKSAATGRLVRELVQRKWRALDEFDHPILEAAPRNLPVSIRLIPPDSEIPSLYIVQDASVVSDPYSAMPDPAKDFAQVLESARQAGASVWVCVNRGILEQAGNHALEGTLKSMLVDLAAARNSGDPRDVLLLERSVLLSWDALDSHSLIRSSDREFRSLTNAATSPDNWSVCSTCPSARVCPFFGNRELLSTTAGMDRFLTLVGDAELLSMQPVVFREAQALLSVILAGVPLDYGTSGPCEWVHERNARDEIFSLASRRLPMMLFAAVEPLGIASSEATASDIDRLGALLTLAGASARLPQSNLMPSVDVGVPRLIGPNGWLRRLDPFKGPIHNDLDGWEVIFAGLDDPSWAPALVGDLERRLLAAWEKIEQYLAAQRADLAMSTLVHRWRSAFSIRYGAFALGRHWFSAELGDFRHAVGLGEPLSDAERDSLAMELQAILQEGAKGIRLTLAAELGGDWANSRLAPEIRDDNEAGLPRLHVVFGGSAPLTVSTESFCWLQYRRKTGLMLWTMPQQIAEAGRLALQRAASQGGYSRSVEQRPPRVSLVIQRPSNSAWTLTRYGSDKVVLDGDVI
ncbi:MAG: hypothetical protein V4558_05665 [Gemmatimonadota bacterium]